MHRFAVAVLCGSFATGALAHDPRPLFIDVDAQALPRVTVSSKVPSSVAATARPQIGLTADCVAAGGAVATRQSDGWASVASFRCGNDLAATGVTIRYPGANPSLSALIRVRDAAVSRQLLAAPGAADVAIGRGAAGPPAAAGFLALGVRHIAGGLDHLLFLACLLAIAGGWRRVVLAATGFTAGHSVTLALAALGVVAVPVVYVEAMIALSVVFLAAEIVRDDRTTLSFRYPAGVAAVFGLLHGFGFASALTALGLPDGEVVAALLFFNLGVEIGQLAFLLLAAVALALLGRLRFVGVQRRQGCAAAAAAVGLAAAFVGAGRIAAFW